MRTKLKQKLYFCLLLAAIIISTQVKAFSNEININEKKEAASTDVGGFVSIYSNIKPERDWLNPFRLNDNNDFAPVSKHSFQDKEKYKINYTININQTPGEIDHKTLLGLVTTFPYVQVPGTPPGIRNQIFNDCVANSISAALEYLTSKTVNSSGTTVATTPLRVSRAAINFFGSLNGQYPSSTPQNWPTTQNWSTNWPTILKESGNYDGGITFEDALDMIKYFGVLPESDVRANGTVAAQGWSYTSANKLAPIPYQVLFGVHQNNTVAQPTFNKYLSIANNLQYNSIAAPTVYDNSFYAQIFSYIKKGIPVLMGFTITNDFENPLNGIVDDRGDRKNLGGHAVLCLGFGAVKGVNCFLIQNSWGTNWANAGRCYMTQKYFEKNFLCGAAVWLNKY